MKDLQPAVRCLPDASCVLPLLYTILCRLQEKDEKRLSRKNRRGRQKKRKGSENENSYSEPLVPATGIEPVRCCHHGILSPGRLPVPPRRHNINIYSFRNRCGRDSCGARNRFRLGAPNDFDRCAIAASLYRPPDAHRRQCCQFRHAGVIIHITSFPQQVRAGLLRCPNANLSRSLSDYTPFSIGLSSVCSDFLSSHSDDLPTLFCFMHIRFFRRIY